MIVKEQFYGTGRRKRASARVFLRPNSQAQGQITINHLPLEEYLPDKIAHITVRQPLDLLNLGKTFDVYVTVKGGGKSGQKDAIRHGLTKALIAYEQSKSPVSTVPSIENEGGESLSFRQKLKKAGFVTQDSRRVERKKTGKPGARKSYPHVKR